MSANISPELFEELVELYYMKLYRFAYTLAHDESTASDLVQQTFLIWATKGHQLRDLSKTKTWLFTTLYREFLGMRKKEVKFPSFHLETVQHEIPPITPDMIDRIDYKTVVDALERIEETFRMPLILFYLEDHSYQEIADALNIPIGTVMSRLARGREHVFRILADFYSETPGKMIRLNPLQHHDKSNG